MATKEKKCESCQLLAVLQESIKLSNQIIAQNKKQLYDKLLDLSKQMN